MIVEVKTVRTFTSQMLIYRGQSDEVEMLSVSEDNIYPTLEEANKELIRLEEEVLNKQKEKIRELKKSLSDKGDLNNG